MNYNDFQDIYADLPTSLFLSLLVHVFTFTRGTKHTRVRSQPHIPRDHVKFPRELHATRAHNVEGSRTSNLGRAGRSINDDPWRDCSSLPLLSCGAQLNTRPRSKASSVIGPFSVLVTRVPLASGSLRLLPSLYPDRPFPTPCFSISIRRPPARTLLTMSLRRT